MYNLALMKNCPVGCKVGQISARARVLLEENLASSINDVNDFGCKNMEWFQNYALSAH